MSDDRTKPSDKPWWLMTPGEDRIEDAKFALRCAENSDLRGLLQEAMEWNSNGDEFHNIPQDVVARCTTAVSGRGSPNE